MNGMLHDSGNGRIAMNVLEVPLSSLRLPSHGKRAHGEDQVSRAVLSIERHGQYQPIVVSEGEILCGVLVYMALSRLGRQTCLVNELGSIPDEKKKELRYLDNQIFDMEGWDEEKLQAFLQGLDSSELDKFGFLETEIELRVNGEETRDGGNGRYPKWKEEWECTSCGWRGVLED